MPELQFQYSFLCACGVSHRYEGDLSLLPFNKDGTALELTVRCKCYASYTFQFPVAQKRPAPVGDAPEQQEVPF